MMFIKPTLIFTTVKRPAITLMMIEIMRVMTIKKYVIMMYRITIITVKNDDKAEITISDINNKNYNLIKITKVTIITTNMIIVMTIIIVIITVMGKSEGL